MDKIDWLMALVPVLVFILVVGIFYLKRQDDTQSLDDTFLEFQKMKYDYSRSIQKLSDDYQERMYAVSLPTPMPSATPVQIYSLVGTTGTNSTATSRMLDAAQAFAKNCAYCGSKIFDGERECCKCGAPVRG